MSGSTEDAPGSRGKKPDGSAYKAHMEALETRNAKARKDGKAKRTAHEQEQAVAQRATERRQDADLRGSKVRGKSQMK
jgi:hypothetical protein